MSELAMPSLTLEPVEEPAVQAAPALAVEEQPAEEVKPVVIDDSMLSEAEKKVVNDFVTKIDITDTQQVMQYGSAAQKHIAAFSETALNQVRTKDLGAGVGEDLANLVTELKNYSPEDPESQKKKGFFSSFKKDADKARAKNAAAEANVDKISGILEQHKLKLMKDVAMLDEMYNLNQQYYKELTMYIVAGKKKLAEVKAGDLEELRRKAIASGAQEDAEAYNDLSNLVERFEKKIGDLELTRMISLQMGPQTRLLQNNDTMMIEKIDTSIMNTIPLWKSQMVISLGLERSRQATAAQAAVTNMTNDLLKKNAEMLKVGTINTAREAERGIVDLETLKQTNRSLIETLDEVMNIQKEGRQQRAVAEEELGRIEGELRQKLLELRK
ncbi:MAG: toxic anion resistance protein [Oscillospiraceae bacterium]|nr:toxic anion resistance protein [Oscillospiraceae bacterium]